MFVVKRDGRKEQVKLEKITKRITRVTKDLKNVDSMEIVQKTISGLYDGVTSRELDNLAIETAAYLSSRHPEYDKLATRLAVTALHKETDSQFSTVIEKLYNVKDSRGKNVPMIADDVYKIIKKHAHVLDSAIDYKRDLNYDYFGFKTLEKSYLLRVHEYVDGKKIKRILERPQHMLMRVAVGIHKSDIDAAINTYNLMSKLQFTHATPTLFNAGTPRNQLSSCFLLMMQDDSIEGIYDTLKQCALISQSAGGIGLAVSNVRPSGSPIYGTGGISNGLVPMLRNFNETARYVDQGGGKRKGSFAIYLEPWHPDILDFLDLRKNNGKEEMRCRDLNLGLWIPDLFIKRVKENGDWTLMDPNRCKGLDETYGEEFEKLYTEYEAKNLGMKTMKAQEIWKAIIQSQIETSQPYMLYKDACNEKNNQKNLGIIKCSNLCAEIIEHVNKDEVAVCNLGSLSLPSCVDGKRGSKKFNFQKLHDNAKVMVQNLNRVIDVNWYPVPEAKYSNMKHRPIGLGVQGLSDVFAQLRISWESEEAQTLNEEIFETIYHAAVETSCEVAEETEPYETFKGSPASEGKLQFDLWGVKPKGDRYDWDDLKAKVAKHGLANSLLVAIMPTASTSQILGNAECIEPMQSNIYKRSTLSGEFMVVNKYLVEDLLEINLWNDEMRQKIIGANGSIQSIAEIPDHIKNIYKTVWEISQKVIIDMAAARGPYICQTQSLNIYMKDPNVSKLSSLHAYSHSKGLKTGMYYLRQQSARDAVKVTVDVETKLPVVETEIEKAVKKLKEMGTDEATIEKMMADGGEQMVIDCAKTACSLSNPGDCEMCSG
jgi:ribonucleoside-diphosphate reductase alpha subunit